MAQSRTRLVYLSIGLFLLLLAGLGAVFARPQAGSAGKIIPGTASPQAVAGPAASPSAATGNSLPSGEATTYTAAQAGTLADAATQSATSAEPLSDSTTPSSTATQIPTPTPTPLPTDPPPPPTATDIAVNATPERIGGPVAVANNHPGPRWVTLQAGHWNNENLPIELTHLEGHTGASYAGVREVDINVAVAQLTAKMLAQRGYKVDLLDATIPVSYTTDLFIALHADGADRTSWRGFKASAPWNSVPASDTFVGFLYEEYGKATGLPSDALTSDAMADYYAFNSAGYRHSITPGVPAALLEMGFVTNAQDRVVLTTQQNNIATGIANAVDRYFRSGAAGATPSPYPTYTPTRTPTSTPTNTPTNTPTSTSTPTQTPTPVPTEFALEASATAAVITPPRPTTTAAVTPPRYTATPSPTATPLQGIVTADGRRLPPLSTNGHSLPQPGSNTAPIYLNDSTEDLPPAPDGRQRVQVWQQFYVPNLGRSIWKKGPLLFVRQ